MQRAVPMARAPSLLRALLTPAKELCISAAKAEGEDRQRSHHCLSRPSVGGRLAAVQLGLAGWLSLACRALAWSAVPESKSVVQAGVVPGAHPASVPYDGKSLCHTRPCGVPQREPRSERAPASTPARVAP